MCLGYWRAQKDCGELPTRFTNVKGVKNSLHIAHHIASQAVLLSSYYATFFECNAIFELLFKEIKLHLYVSEIDCYSRLLHIEFIVQQRCEVG